MALDPWPDDPDFFWHNVDDDYDVDDDGLDEALRKVRTGVVESKRLLATARAGCVR